MNLLRKLVALKTRRSLKADISRSSSIRVILGADVSNYPGWIPTDYPVLDVTDGESWSRLFEPGSIDALLSEHVFEHLADDQIASAFSYMHTYLMVGGYVRIGVPDGYHPDAEYIEAVKPGGSGWGSDDHKQLFNFRSLSQLLERSGFSVRPLEWFDENGDFHFNEWSPENGMIRRSSRYDERNLHKPLSYTSLIIDAYKLRSE